MKRNNAIQEKLSVRFRHLLSGAPDGNPPWLDVVARGDEPGYFLPTDAPWVIHRDFGTLVGGIRALLMQATHPAALAGVRQHSRYAADPLGRLAGTIRWLTVTTFASKSEVLKEASRVNRLHEHVKGTYRDAAQAELPYRAAQEEFLLWVHVAFMESFLVAHQWYASAPIPKGHALSPADNYVKQWAIAAQPLGLAKAPQTLAEAEALISQLLENRTLRADQDTFEVVKFIQNPPLPKIAMPIYRLLFEAAVVSLRPEVRKMLQLEAKPEWFVVPATRIVLRLMRWAIGPESPIEDAAIARLKRINYL
ncbi:MAG: oxygenase MpaB family protein [Micrococcales bacterium]